MPSGPGRSAAAEGSRKGEGRSVRAAIDVERACFFLGEGGYSLVEEGEVALTKENKGKVASGGRGSMGLARGKLERVEEASAHSLARP